MKMEFLPPIRGHSMNVSDAQFRILCAVCCGGFLFQADLTALSAILLDVSHDVQNDWAAPVWLMDIYSLALIFALPVAGSLADMFGRRRLFLIGVGLFAVSSILCALAPEFFSLLLFRATQGISGALLTTSGAGLLAQSYEGSARRYAFSTLGIVIGASMTIGPPLGSLLAQTVGWRWLFWLNVPGAALIFWLARNIEDVAPRRTHQVDWLGCSLFAIGTASICFILLEMSHLLDHPSWLIALITAAFASIIAFVQVELNNTNAAIDISLFRSRPFLAICLVPIASSISYWSLLVYVPQFARGSLGMEPADVGWLLCCLTAPMLVLPRWGAKLAGKVRPGAFFGSCLAIIGLADLVLSVVAAQQPTITATGLALLAAGVGSALVNAQISAAAVAVVPMERAAMASAISTLARQFGFALGVALLGLLLDQGSFSLAFLGAAIAGLASAVMCCLLLGSTTKL